MATIVVLLWRFIYPDSIEEAVFYGVAAYLAYSFGSKAMLLSHHRQGISLINQESFQEAIRAFQASYARFSRWPWLDRFRFLTLLDSSAISYREMALCNIAYCYLRLGQTEQAQEYYRKALSQFPESELAELGLSEASKE
ncbi:MAG: tetratricopeptide repeat protein [Blastocatellia bacterium]|nr:tetratricopeptide repeat protein [Blastocatellia bacterium]